VCLDSREQQPGNTRVALIRTPVAPNTRDTHTKMAAPRPLLLVLLLLQAEGATSYRYCTTSFDLSLHPQFCVSSNARYEEPTFLHLHFFLLFSTFFFILKEGEDFMKKRPL
jgi:hypothetical protein